MDDPAMVTINAEDFAKMDTRMKERDKLIEEMKSKLRIADGCVRILLDRIEKLEKLHCSD